MMWIWEEEEEKRKREKRRKEEEGGWGSRTSFALLCTKFRMVEPDFRHYIGRRVCLEEEEVMSSGRLIPPPPPPPPFLFQILESS